MENGNVISVRPDAGTLVTFHDMPTSPMAKVGRSAARGDEEEERILRHVDNVCVVLVSVIEEYMSCKSRKRPI